MRRRIVLPMLMAVIGALLGGCGSTRSSEGGPACLAALSRHNVAFASTQASDPNDSRCAVDTAVRVSRIEVPLVRPATMSCALATRFDRFEREVIQPVAADELGKRVTRVDHLGSYSCRNQSGTRGRLSQHALGQAIDVSGFRLSDGSTVSVERDWHNSGRKGEFLRQLARRACRYFSVVLTPSSNADHYNHFHFDIGPGKLCSGV